MDAIQELKILFAKRSGADIAIEINGFTGFRTTLLEELTDTEAKQLLEIHQPQKTVKQLQQEVREASEEILKKGWKSKVLVVAEATGIKDKDGFVRFNKWMLKSSIYKKHLNAYSLEELKELHKQLQGVKANNSKSAKKPLTKSWWREGLQNKNLN
ncbi:hypothetical protein GCM10023210_31040 [Chryseobacterium ginsengisoli]|uniref:Uncharacterized protein n=1 Tax=Chryseobacterium ginsengisoli TaxID=363853 RepID=A0ABP9MKD2_9FLAO